MQAKASKQQTATQEAMGAAAFCEAHGISRALLYMLWRDGKGPARMRVRGRVLISREAAENWRREVESQSEAA